MQILYEACNIKHEKARKSNTLSEFWKTLNLEIRGN